MTRTVPYVPPPDPVTKWGGVDISDSPNLALGKAVEVVDRLRGEQPSHAAHHYQSFFSATSKLLDLEAVFPGVGHELGKYSQHRDLIAEETREWRVPSYADKPLMVAGAAVGGLILGYIGHRLQMYGGAGIGAIVGAVGGSIAALLGIGQAEIMNDTHLEMKRTGLLDQAAEQFTSAIDELVEEYER
tara:strand:+ start:1029 stop:1589 length:561 start_codon:yes stop_codon:yes gene_type:complete